MSMPKLVVSEEVPPGELWFVTPGETMRVTFPDGETREYTIRPARVHKIVNIKVEEKHG
jgi:hypothetical protein